MNAKQQAKFKMYRSTQSHCATNEGIWSPNPAFNGSFKVFGSIIVEIDAHETAVSKKITGISKDKAQLKTDLATLACRIGAQVFAFASKAKNNSLKKEVDFSISDLLRIKDELFVPTIKNIYDAANNNLKQLADYGLGQEDLTELATMMKSFKDASPTTRTAIGSRAAKTKSLTELFKEGDRILKEEMDKLVLSFNKKNPVFVEEYTNARKIMDVASRVKLKVAVPVS